ncbi:MAG: hypothetical protein JWQ32_2967 [Marmoricola sp.]|nr:hypothetical protein [Marmoricola sp.]
MSTRRDARITRRSAAQALDQTGSSGAASVDQVLSAAVAPASASELSREAVTTALFRQAHVGGLQATTRPTVAQRTRRRFAAGRLVVAGATALALSTGGVALAASTGHLPFGGDHRSATGARHSSEAPGMLTTHPTGSDYPTNGASEHPSAAPTPSFRGLCRAFRAGAGGTNGKALESPALTALAAIAGGRANIAAYCTSLLGAPGTHPSATPTQPVHPTHPVKPTQAPTPTHPAHPTPTPTHPTHPTRSPSPRH